MCTSSSEGCGFIPSKASVLEQGALFEIISFHPGVSGKLLQLSRQQNWCVAMLVANIPLTVEEIVKAI